MDPLDISVATPDDLSVLVDLAVQCQADPARHCTYLGSDPTSIAADLTEHSGWPTAATVARHGQQVVGWLFTDADDEMGRAWWWGPFVSEGRPWADVADALYTAASAHLGDGVVWAEELAGDDRSVLLRAFADRQGFTAEEGSACLVLAPDRFDPPPDHPSGTITIRRLVPGRDAEAAAVADLHERLFPGSHLTGTALVASTDPSLSRWAALDGATVVGYVATERQHDDSEYIDFLGVEPDRRSAGLGRRLVGHACADGFERRAVFVHLTVRVSNIPALQLYRSVGFETERILAPHRKNHTVAG